MCHFYALGLASTSGATLFRQLSIAEVLACVAAAGTAMSSCEGAV